MDQVASKIKLYDCLDYCLIGYFFKGNLIGTKYIEY